MKLLFLLPIAALSLGISAFSNFKSLESMFLALCALIMSSLIFIFAFGLTAAVIIILIVIAAFFIAGIVYSVVKKRFVSFLKNYFNSPALWILILGTIVYHFMIRDAKILGHDDFNFWAMAPKVIMQFDGFAAPSRLLSAAHPYGLPTFYSFVSWFPGYSYDVMLTGKWLLFWTCLLMPLAKYTYKHSLRVLFYSFIVFAIVLSDSNFHQELFSDIVVYSMWTGLVGYYYINRSSKALNWVLLGGLFVLPQLKAYFGIILTLFVLMIIVFDKLYYGKGKLKKNDWLLVSASGGLLAVNLILQEFIDKVIARNAQPFYKFKYGGGSVLAPEPYNNMWESITHTLKTSFGMIMIAAVVLLIAATLFVLYKKRKKAAIVLGAAALIAAAVVATKMILLMNGKSFEMIGTVSGHFKNQFYLSIRLPQILIYIATVSITYYFFVLKESRKKYFRQLSIITIAQFAIIVLIVYLDFARKNYQIFIEAGTSMDRYLGVSVYFFIFIIPMYLIGEKDAFGALGLKHKILFAYLAVLFVALNFMPGPMQIYDEKVENMEIYSISFSGLETNDITIREAAQEDEKVCIIYDVREYNERVGYIDILLKYFTLIPSDNYVRLDMDSDIETQITNLGVFIEKNEIDKVFYKGSSEDFETAFRSLFLNHNEVIRDRMYDIVWVDGIVKLDRIKN